MATALKPKPKAERTRTPGPSPGDPDACGRCGSALDKHQPDPGRPGRLLACCLDCGTWYQVNDLTGERAEVPRPWRDAAAN